MLRVGADTMELPPLEDGRLPPLPDAARIPAFPAEGSCDEMKDCVAWLRECDTFLALLLTEAWDDHDMVGLSGHCSSGCLRSRGD